MARQEHMMRFKCGNAGDGVGGGGGVIAAYTPL